MARRKSDVGAVLTNLATGIGALFGITRKLVRKTDPFGNQQRQQELRLTYFRTKYSDEAIAWRVTRGEYWPGQTGEQLSDSLGPPAAVDDIQLKTRKRQVWKYNRTGINRYSLRITLDDDVVASWNQKN